MVSFWGLLGILFIALKLTGFIAWSWWLVLLPLYFGLVLWFVIMFSGGILILVGTAFSYIFGRK